MCYGADNMRHMHSANPVTLVFLNVNEMITRGSLTNISNKFIGK